MTTAKQRRHKRLINRNLMLLLLVWLRQYPTSQQLSSQFSIHSRNIQRRIRRLIPILSSAIGKIQWPSLEQLSERIIYDPVLGNIAGYIDGTRHKIQRPSFANKPPVLTSFRSNERRRAGLTEQQRLAFNNRLSHYGIGIEHVTKDIKLFRVMSDAQRHFKNDQRFYLHIANCIFGLAYIRFEDFNTDVVQHNY
ncbi:unnamed protein product [Didymodactylos carnosus]|uniref:Transposase Helix-turn-helix domain-containing protein n=1 Tax=Didymodactylos carnosus TaxID=1234261 RepID=A0A815T550_9BILA|nr:unnamed protein product [Didymodactylos carnosus]CAF1499048.1 unnamed protein product [Didymodactylos carnosus]CAF3974941.1 unnamed protein product [Didymodactylos carnosus]CAF4360980.1 unnamed protein product [Didymodactylos carnosus]